MSNELKTLTVTVEGPPHTGKSTVIILIAKALQEAGYENIVINAPDKNYQPLTPEVARTRVDRVVVAEKPLLAPNLEALEQALTPYFPDLENRQQIQQHIQDTVIRQRGLEALTDASRPPPPKKDEHGGMRRLHSIARGLTMLASREAFPDAQLDVVHEELAHWAGVDVTREQAIELIKADPEVLREWDEIYYEGTWMREKLMDQIAKQCGYPHWPLNGDAQAFNESFLPALRAGCEKLKYGCRVMALDAGHPCSGNATRPKQSPL